VEYATVEEYIDQIARVPAVMRLEFGAAQSPGN